MTIFVAEIDGMRGLAGLGEFFRALTCGEIKMLCPHFGRRELTSRRARSLNQIPSCPSLI